MSYRVNDYLRLYSDQLKMNNVQTADPWTSDNINVSCTFMSHLELPRIDFLLFSLITGKYPALAQTFEVYGYLYEIRLNFKPRTGRSVDVVLGNNWSIICQIMLAKLQGTTKRYSFVCILVIKSKSCIICWNNFLQNNVSVVVYNYCNFALSIRLYIN